MSHHQCPRGKSAEDEYYVRLGKTLSLVMRGRKYVKQSELTNALLMQYAAARGDIMPVELFQVNVQKFDGREFTVTMEVRPNQGKSQSTKSNTVKELKGRIEETDGTSRWQQQLFLANAASINRSRRAIPLQDCDLIDSSSPVVLYVAGKSIF